MAVFPSFKLTKKGEELLNRSIGEGKILTFTKFEIGDGNPPSDFREQTSLVNKFYQFPVLSTDIQKNQVLRIKGYFDNKSFTGDKQLKEIGVFVKIENDETEYLYSYTNAGESGDIIPGNTRGFYSRTLDVANYIGYATNITFNIEQLRDRYAFNSENEMKVASYLKAGDKVELWGNLVLGDKPTDEYIIQESGEIQLSNGLFAKKVSFKYITQTIEEMKKLALKVGDIVEVLGYYTAGDGAEHKRIIENKDNGSGIQLSNGMWANLIHGDTVYSSHFGVKADGVYDNADILQKMLDYAQSKAPDVILDIIIDNKEGAILCTKPLDITCNGWTGKLSMNGGYYYGAHLYFKNDVQQPVCIYTKQVESDDGIVYDRFGNRLYSNGNFTIENLKIRINHTRNEGGVDYAIKSDFVDGIDVSSSSYINVRNNFVRGAQGSGINVGKWDVFVEYNTVDSCGVGISVSKRTSVNTDADLVTNNLVVAKNDINTCRNHIYSYNNTYLKIVDNTLDVSAGASIVCTIVVNDLIIEKNYIERANIDNLSEEISFLNWDGSRKTQQITAKIIVNQSSNYDYDTSIIIRDNQIPNNTGHKNHSILAVNGIKNIIYKNNGKRGYKINDIQFFGIGCWVNQYGSLSNNIEINLTGPLQNNAINYNLYGTNYYKALPDARISAPNEPYITKRFPFLICDNNCIENLVVAETQDRENKIFKLGTTATYIKDYTNSIHNKPYSLKFYAEQATTSSYAGAVTVKIYLDSVLKYTEPVLSLHTDGRVMSWIPTLWLGKDYKILKIELVPTIGCDLTNFCITSENSPVFASVEKKPELPVYKTLDTPYYTEKMKSEGVYDDFISYMDSKIAYDKYTESERKSKIEPQPSQELQKFIEKYL